MNTEEEGDRRAISEEVNTVETKEAADDFVGQLLF
jgi:hypothetical protein